MNDKEMHEIQARASLDLIASKPGLSKFLCGRAIDHCNRGLELDDKDIRFYYLRAIAYAKSDCYPEALRDYDYAIKLYDQSSELYLLRASAHEKMGALDKAQTDRDKALELAKEQRQTELAESIQKNWPR